MEKRLAHKLFNANNEPTSEFAALLDAINISERTAKDIDAALQARFFPKHSDERPVLRTQAPEIPDVTYEEIREELAVCGFIGETKPSKERYDYAIWPGARLKGAAPRLGDAMKAWESGVRWKHMVALSGERAVMEDEAQLIMGNENPFPNDDFHWKHPDDSPTTEYEMMLFLYRRARMDSNMRFAPSTTFINTPLQPPAMPEGKPRNPSIEDTLKTYMQHCSPKPGSVLVFTQAPYRTAFDEAVAHHLGSDFDVETVGRDHTPGLSTKVFLREVTGATRRCLQYRGLLE